MAPARLSTLTTVSPMARPLIKPSARQHEDERHAECPSCLPAIMCDGDHV